MERHYHVQKYEKSGSEKRHSFSITGNVKPSTIVIVEGPIDLLSVACLENLKHREG